MAGIVWDAQGERFYETGTDHGVYYPLTSGTYTGGVAWNGLTGVTESPTGAEATDLYADNIKYGTMRSAENLEGTITAYTYPDEFAESDGYAELVKGVKIGQQNRKIFGLSYRTQIGNDESDNVGYYLHLVYGITVSPSEKAYATINDSPEALEFSWEFTTTPVSVSGHKASASLTIDSRTADAEKLSALEAILYGTGTGGSAQPRMPLPDEVLTLMTPDAGV